jgi:non-heme chloroperoxidase
MPTITTRDGAHIFYKDWGSGPAVVFSHGWPLNADARDDQLFLRASHGYRAIAHDRRGHGRSTQTWSGNDMDTYADDLAALVAALKLDDVVHIGHSTGGGEVVRYVARHGTKRVSKIVLVSAVPPFLLKTADNPEGLPLEVFDGIRAGLAADRSQYWKDFAVPFYGANRPGAKISEGIRDAFWQTSMQAGAAAAIQCVKAFSETDFRADLAKIDVPTLVIHGDDDQIVPIDAGGRRSAKMIGGAKLLVYEGAPHALMTTHRERFNNDLLTFIESSAREAQAAD